MGNFRRIGGVMPAIGKIIVSQREFWLFWSQGLDPALGSYSGIPFLSNHKEFQKNTIKKIQGHKKSKISCSIQIINFFYDLISKIGLTL